MTEAFDAQAIKLRVARAQLGAALDLFIHDKDPLSVQALACGGSEVIEGLATTADISTFSTHILATFPDVDIRKIRYLRNNIGMRSSISTRETESQLATTRN